VPLIDASINLQLWRAIEEKRLIKVTYQNKPRILEPHDYGIHNGVAKLLGYQVGGLSSHKLPGWRLMEESLVRDIELLDRQFAGGRRSSPGKHHKWDKLFIRVKPARAKD
jgi:hypothetical protein